MGMHCPSCEILIKEVLEELPGVNKAEASYKAGIVSVDFDDKRISEDNIIEAITKEGHIVE